MMEIEEDNKFKRGEVIAGRPTAVKRGLAGRGMATKAKRHTELAGAATNAAAGWWGNEAVKPKADEAVNEKTDLLPKDFAG